MDISRGDVFWQEITGIRGMLDVGKAGEIHLAWFSPIKIYLNY